MESAAQHCHDAKGCRLSASGRVIGASALHQCETGPDPAAWVSPPMEVAIQPCTPDPVSQPNKNTDANSPTTKSNTSRTK